MKNIPLITDEDVRNALDYPTLIGKLKSAFAESKIEVPQRHHHDFKLQKSQEESSLLLMPAWKALGNIGIKLVSVFPSNALKNLPSINALYLLFDGENGKALALMDAGMLTSMRTAAASALASSYLSRKTSQTLLVLGTGKMLPCLIEAHSAIRDIKQVYIWGRNFTKASTLAKALENEHQEIKAVQNYQPILKEVDIISCATLSKSPILFGKDIYPGQHIDLIGAFKPDMREADNDLMKRASIFVDIKSSMLESGDIAIPLAEKVITKGAILADLFDLCTCAENKSFRKTMGEITVFKSVGHALEDYVAAEIVYDKLNK